MHELKQLLKHDLVDFLILLHLEQESLLIQRNHRAGLFKGLIDDVCFTVQHLDFRANLLQLLRVKESHYFLVVLLACKGCLLVLLAWNDFLLALLPRKRHTLAAMAFHY